MMKYCFAALCVLAGLVAAQAQTSDRFMASLADQVLAVAVERGVPATQLPAQVTLVERSDAAGVRQWEVQGVDSLVRSVVMDALERVETPAPAEDAQTRFSIRIPVEKIAAAQQIEPLLFRGKEASAAFSEWVHGALRARGMKGSARVRFYVEADGWVKIDKVTQSSSAKFARELTRLVRASRDQWTPRRVRGVAQRTTFVYGIEIR